MDELITIKKSELEIIRKELKTLISERDNARKQYNESLNKQTVLETDIQKLITDKEQLIQEKKSLIERLEQANKDKIAWINNYEELKKSKVRIDKSWTGGDFKVGYGYYNSKTSPMVEANIFFRPLFIWDKLKIGASVGYSNQLTYNGHIGIDF